MSIVAEKLRENTAILVRGKVAFSRIASQFTGESLQRRIANSKAIYPTKRPHTTINLVDVEIIPASEDGQLNNEEQFVKDRFYVSKTGNNAGRTGWSIDDTSNFLPAVFAPTPEGVHKRVDPVEGELDKELDVTLVLQVFKPREYEKRGLGMQQIIVNEELRYYSNNVSTEALQRLGVVLEGSTRQVSADQAAVAEPAAAEAADTDENGMPLPGTGGAGASATATPAQSAQPAAPAAPQPEQAPATAAQPTAAPQAPETAPQGQGEQKTVEQLQAEIAALQAQQQAPANPPQPNQQGSAFDADQAPSPWG